MVKFAVYTDGACSGNPGPGGWAAIIIDENGKTEILKGRKQVTTNNQMELTAFIEAVKKLKKSNAKLIIYSDSKYLIDGINFWLPKWKERGWKTSNKKPVKNQEFWQEIDKLIRDLNFELIWIKGHHKDKYNEMADAIAVEESQKF